jgi:hypothetical protein
METQVKYGDRLITCYGELLEDSNFDVICVDADDDDIWLIGNPLTDKPFKSWAEVVNILSDHYFNAIVEISAC